jgi:hypothetical protein
MLVLYTKVLHYIWRPSGACLQFQRTMNSVPRTKVKMVRMLMIITLVNVVLITPIYLLQTIVALFQPDYMDPFWYCAFMIVMFSSSVMKPAIYMCYNSNFRRGCREVFCMSNMQIKIQWKCWKYERNKASSSYHSLWYSTSYLKRQRIYNCIKSIYAYWSEDKSSELLALFLSYFQHFHCIFIERLL